MGRAPCCSKVGLHRGPWTAVEDELLINYIRAHGEGHWRSLPKKAGLFRCGKSCRLRWMNYLRPDIKRGNITPDEDDLIIRLHNLLGNRWSLIAGRLPGRTDNEIKNYWNSHLSKRLDPATKEKFFIRERRKRSTFRSNSDKKRRLNQHGANGEITKTKIHLPKAVRVSSVSVPRTTSPSEGSWLAGFGSTQVHNPPGDWSSLEVNNGEGSFPCNGTLDQDLAYGHVSSWANYISTSEDNMLDEIVKGYENLAQTDDDYTQLESFIDSLLL